MARDESEDFRVRPGRSRSHGARINPRTQPFFKQVQIAVRKAGGDPRRIGAEGRSGNTRKGGSTGRFNARGRGAKVVASLPREGGNGGWQRDSAGRFRGRRVVVKARVVRLNPQGRGAQAPKMRTTVKAVDAHLRYLERDGVTRDAERGKAYTAFENEADGKAFVERGREDRHQFRFIVAPEDSAEMPDLRGFTRDLMRQMELDLATRLDWIAVDHHNTGHPHTHIIVRGVLDDGRILNIAGDYIAHGIRHRASELVTRELGHQSEIELQAKLQNEVEAERLTRLDKMLLSEQREQAVIDLRPGEEATWLVRENRNLMIGRVKHLERYGLATEAEPGKWVVSDRAEPILTGLGERNEVINSIHRALVANGLAEERGVGQYTLHGEGSGEKIVGRVLAKGLARDDELSERVHLVVDGIDGKVHHIEFKDPSRIEEVGRDMIVEAAPVVSGPRPADRNIAANAAEDGGVYRPSQHLGRIRDSFERQGKDPEAFIRSHVRRLEALRRAGHVERVDADHWKVPKDIVERGQAHDLSRGGDGLRVRTLSVLNLEKQIGSHGATWLDRELIVRERVAIVDSGFGREVSNALGRRARRLVEMGLATTKDGNIHIPVRTVATLERQEVDSVGHHMARERGLTYMPANAGEYVSGRLAGIASLVSGRFAMIENGLGFQLVPWQPNYGRRRTFFDEWSSHSSGAEKGSPLAICWEGHRRRSHQVVVAVYEEEIRIKIITTF
jgi:type IV secretory pathway VirD2 relaxase